jgi:hypothetical protein
MSSRASRILLAAGDVVALIVFTVIGLINHQDGVTIGGVAQVVLPIAGVGAVTTWFFGTYRRPGIATLLPAWAISVPAGLLIRKALFHTPETWGKTGIFLCVAMAFTLLFLLAWRIIARVFFHLEPADTPAPTAS